MNTTELKRFAQGARKKLLEQVGSKLSFVLSADSPELREKTQQIKQLREELNKTTKEQLIEKVAYTWFNRLMALRFMDANDYQPLGIRIITPKDGYTSPELLDEAKRGNIPEDLAVKRQRIYDLLDGKIPSTNPQNEAFKELLIAACNHLHTTFPFLFEKINDYTELLLPDDLTSDFSIVTDIREGMPSEDCKNVEVIGWLYQFYISEKKDEVFASRAKIKKEDIPAATQLFTPRWIVEYMVQNTLGKLWIQNHPKSRLRGYMPYFIESASLKSDDYLKISLPEEIKFLDPASGSGHILVYAFDLFTKIYEEEGYNTSDIPKLIIEKNLYGFEIDERAAQLSGLALMMKAREYQRRAFKEDLQPNILSYKDLHLNTNEINETLNDLHVKISNGLMDDLLQMKQATNFGSLIIPHANKSEIFIALEKLNQFLPNADVFLRSKMDALLSTFHQILSLAEKYHCLCTNPPYMGSGNMNIDLSEFVKTNYPDSKIDLMACFMESGLTMLHTKGFLGMINQHSWMFLSSYEKLRKKLIKNIHIDSLLHLGAKTFPEIGGEVVQNSSFVFWKNLVKEKNIYVKLVDFNSSEQKRQKMLEALNNKHCEWIFSVNQTDIMNYPAFAILYDVSESVKELFNQKIHFETEDRFARKGMTTSNNDKYLKLWFEVNHNKCSFNHTNSKPFDGRFKWSPVNRGSDYRKWYGSYLELINWDNNGEQIKNEKSSVIANEQLFFKKGLNFNVVTSQEFNCRYFENGFIFLTSSPCVFQTDDRLLPILGMLNSKVGNLFIKMLTPNLGLSSGTINKIPYKENPNYNSLIEERVTYALDTCKRYWDSLEISWDFKINELINIKSDNTLELLEVNEFYQQFWQLKFTQLHQIEEELNRDFIELYGLKEELTPDVQLEDITILQDELDRKALKGTNSKLVRTPNTLAVQNYNELRLLFNTKEILTQLISYSVGCMFGRYSLDKEGLVLASQGETFQDYLQKIDKSEDECSFLPDEDNIIPILDDEWFEDDIVGKFHQFLKVAFGERNFNKNLSFVEGQVGKDIRRYLIKDFYTDHLKRYKKRPIYWMFSSPNGSFSVLIYMHRYTPDTVSNILNKYLKEFIGKLKTRKEHLQQVQVSGSPTEKTKAIKETDSIDKMLIELQEYERDILYPFATERIAIDLDDGVLVNYNKFGKALKEVNGLNDSATKKKVRQFDWIDATQIR